MPLKFNLMRMLATVLISALFFACETDSDIGLDINKNPNSGAFYSDTTSITSGTYLMDSVITSDQFSGVLGVAEDPIFGKITASLFLQPGIAVSSVTGIEEGPDITGSFVPDSVVLRLFNRNLVYFGDSTANVTFNIHRLKTSLPQRNFNNDDNVAYEPSPLASFTFNLQSFRSRVDTVDFINPLEIRLPKSILDEITPMIGTDKLSTTANFEAAFPGFALVPTDNSRAIYSFDIGASSTTNSFSSLIYYFHETDSEEIDGYIFEFKGKRFNKITTDRNQTVLNELRNKKDILSSTKTNGNLYVQAGTGISTVLQFPSIANSKERLNITQADLVFEVDANSINENFRISPLLVPLQLNSNKSVRRDNLFGYSYVANTLNQNSALLGFYSDSLKTVRMDVTSYLRAITLNKAADNGLVISAGSTIVGESTSFLGVAFNAGLNRIVLKKPKLEIYYTK